MAMFLWAPAFLNRGSQSSGNALYWRPKEASRTCAFLHKLCCCEGKKSCRSYKQFSDMDLVLFDGFCMDEVLRCGPGFM